MPKLSETEQQPEPRNWREPAEKWIPREIRKRLTEIEMLVEMLRDVTGRSNEPSKR